MLFVPVLGLEPPLKRLMIELVSLGVLVLEPMPVGVEGSDIGVPDTVITAPGWSVWPPIIRTEPEFLVYVSLVIVRTLGSGTWIAAVKGMVELPPRMLAAEVERDIGVPERFMTPPAVRVCPSIRNADADVTA